jgi:hypothetical protein
VRYAVTAVVLAVAFAAGLWLASFDMRTDDTGVEAALVFAIAAALSFVRPRTAIAVALLVGGIIPIAEVMRGSGFPGGIAALGFSVVGAVIGGYAGAALRRNTVPSA